MSAFGPSTEITKSSPSRPSKEPNNNNSAPLKPVLILIESEDRSATMEFEKL